MSKLRINKIRRNYPFLFILCFIFIHCGRKGIPPSPDRFSPKVREIVAVDRNHLEILFSEEMSKDSAEKTENFLVSSGEGERLSVLSALLENDKKTLHLTTEPQEDSDYFIEFSGVLDVSGNEVKGGRKSFRGSTHRDEIAPHVLSLFPTSGMTRVSPDTGISITFSESMDTSSVRSGVILLPFGVGAIHELPLQWNNSLAQVRVRLEGGFQESLVYRVYIPKGCQDIEGNPSRDTRSTYFTVDDSLPKGSISGMVSFEDPKGTLIGLLDAGEAHGDSTLLLSLDLVREEEGGFRLSPLSDGSYLLVGWKEKEGEVHFGEYGPIAILGEEPVEDLRLVLKSDGEEGPASVLKKYYSMMQ